MKTYKKNISNYTPQEFDIGALLLNDEIFELCRESLNPEMFLDEDLKKLVNIMKNNGNSIANIIKVDKFCAEYAFELANLVSRWMIEIKEKNYESLKDESFSFLKFS